MNNNKKVENLERDSVADSAQLDWGRFSLHINQRESVVALILSDSHGVQKRLASYPYEESPSLEELACALRERIVDVCVKSLDRALKKWAGFLEVELPKILITRRRQRLVSSAEMSESFDKLLRTVKAIQKDPSIHDAEYPERFMWQLKDKLESLQSRIAGDVGPRFLEKSQIIDVCTKVQESILHQLQNDPMGILDDSKELARFMWQFWNVIRPVISSKSGWHVLERDALPRKPKTS